jgi:hypothetical protein
MEDPTEPLNLTPEQIAEGVKYFHHELHRKEETQDELWYKVLECRYLSLSTIDIIEELKTKYILTRR